MDQGQLNELLEFQINRNIINLYKSFLITMEDMHDQHDSNFKKLKKSMPKDIDLINQADYWDDERMEYLRKKILDQGNDALREIIGHLEKFNLTTK